MNEGDKGAGSVSVYHAGKLLCRVPVAELMAGVTDGDFDRVVTLQRDIARRTRLVVADQTLTVDDRYILDSRDNLSEQHPELLRGNSKVSLFTRKGFVFLV